LLALCTLLVTGSGCASCGQSFLGVISGPINDPSNRSLRRDILSFGIKQFCPEMVHHNAPLKLQEDTPAIGRFYPRTCTQQMLENGDLFVQLSGVGYAYTNVSKKISFQMSGTVTYDPDFLMDGGTMYAYFRTRQVQGSNFQTRLIEQPVANLINQLAPLGDQFGRQLVSGKLGEGFTVIRESSGNADFGLGMIERGKRPVHPFDIKTTERTTYENMRVEVHQGERDFIGPIVVTGTGHALFVTANMDGAPAVDVLYMRKDEAEASLELFLGYPQVGPLAGPPFMGDVIQAGAPYARTVPVAEGTYYIVIDNTASAGQVAPPANLFDDRAAVINYVVQLGDAP
jgi:hypothetical protein